MIFESIFLWFWADRESKNLKKQNNYYILPLNFYLLNIQFVYYRSKFQSASKYFKGVDLVHRFMRPGPQAG